MIDSHHLSPHDARERMHARRETKLRGLFGLPREQMKKQHANLVPLPKTWINTDGAQMIENYRTRYAIVYQYCPRHLPVNHQPAQQRWHVHAIDRSSTPGTEVLGLLVSVQDSLDASIAIAGRIDGTTS